MPNANTHDPTFLRALAQHLDAEPRQAVSARDIGNELGLDEQALIQVTERLRREGLIDSRPGPRRMAQNKETEPLILTEAGWAHAKTIRGVR